MGDIGALWLCSQGHAKVLDHVRKQTYASVVRDVSALEGHGRVLGAHATYLRLSLTRDRRGPRGLGMAGHLTRVGLNAGSTTPSS